MQHLKIINNDRPSNIQTSQLTGQNQFGIVTVCQQGKAQFIAQHCIQLQVYAQGSHVPYLTKGDEVLFTVTDKGAYILARNCQKHEAPSIHLQQINAAQVCLQFGSCELLLNKTGELHIRNAHADIKLHDHGVQITADQGYIEFNTPT